MNAPDVRAAIELQNEYRARISLRDEFGDLRIVAGVDVGYDLERELTKAVIAVFDWPSLSLQTSIIAYAPTDFPYIPGLLAFREVPAILKALHCLTEKPDLLMVDGQGVAHPRRMGIAAHLGVEADIPAIGVGKSRLCGLHDDVPEDAFSMTDLTDKDERIGTVLRSKAKCNPLYISAGHRISQKTALEIVLQSFRGYRLPEPTRIADQISKWKIGDSAANNGPLFDL
ncbi:MAG: deoxyribonuclease V [Micavibrio aeruginosavorus]|uniref:Endonuclease V n=1 Tax=Micavibrio aeruginosavorus TaxID=349221 RepID=A0A2W5BRD3_9BACT|nr:MAG: deoxyribonuclease V [Micavibrio aeruginosavorus]